MLFLWLTIWCAGTLLSILSYRVPLSPRPSCHGIRFHSDKLSCGTSMNEKADLGLYCQELLLGKLGKSFQQPLSEHPGFAFNLGCDEWASSGYHGTVRCWSATPHSHWVSISRMYLNSQSSASTDTTTNSSDTNPLKVEDMSTISANRPDYRVDVNVFAHDSITIPHMRASVSHYGSSDSYRLYLDYIPRYDIIATPAYYDLYFQGIDEEHYRSTRPYISSKAMRKLPVSASVLTRLLTSAFAISVDLQSGKLAADTHSASDRNNPEEIIHQLIEEHINRWCSWLPKASNEELVSALPPTSQRTQRDQKIQSLLFDEIKFSLAEHLGPDFAPKAEDISAAMVGPLLGH